jgi:hypothetical protein
VVSQFSSPMKIGTGTALRCRATDAGRLTMMTTDTTIWDQNRFQMRGT